MSEDKITTLYVCPVCHNTYSMKSAAEECLRTHESEMICRRIELGHTLGCTRYSFFGNAFRISAEYKMNMKVVMYGLHDGYPRFATECLDNDADILAAKKRLIEAARKWMEKYNEVLAGLERELEAEND